MSAFIDGAYLGRVHSGPTESVFVELYGKVFKAAIDPRDQEIADLKDSNARLADELAAAKERAGDTWNV